MANIVCKQISSKSFKNEITYKHCVKQMTDVKLWLLYNNAWNQLCAKKRSGLFKTDIYKMCLQIIYI